MTYKQFFVLMSCFILKQALVAQVVPPPATQAEVNAGVNRFKYVTPYTLGSWSGGGGGGSGGTNFPAVQGIYGVTNLTLQAGKRTAWYEITNGNHGINATLAVPESGHTFTLISSNANTVAITNTLYTNSVVATFYDPLLRAKASTWIIPAGSINVSEFIFNTSGDWIRIEHAAFSSPTQMVAAAIGSLTISNTIEQLGDGLTPGSHTLYGTNSVGVTTKAAISNSVPVTNVVGLVHKAYAAYIAINCNLEQDVHITNRIAGNVIVDWLNAAQGQTLKLRLHGAASGGTDYFVTNTFPSGWLVANQSSNTAPLAVQLPVLVLDGTGAELNIRNYRLFTGTTNIAGAIINTYTE